MFICFNQTLQKFPDTLSVAVICYSEGGTITEIITVQLEGSGCQCYWGEIQSCTTYSIFPWVYYVDAKCGAGIVVPKDVAKKTLSRKALRFADEEDGRYYYERSSTMEIVQYELLKSWMENSGFPEGNSPLCKELNDIKQWGHFFIPEYFGDFPPPQQAPGGFPELLKQVCSGILFVRCLKRWYFAVNERIGEEDLSPFLKSIAIRKNQYMFFPENIYAIPIFELAKLYPELDQQIISHKNLHAVLRTQFQDYVLYHNRSVQKSLEEASNNPLDELITNLFPLDETFLIPDGQDKPGKFIDLP